ncbi:MAG: M43 family zinc metalloprotease [Flavobacteriales bacterium]
MSYWIPDATTPIKEVAVAVHVFQASGGGGLAFLDIPAHRAIIEQQLAWVNQWFANNAAPSDPLSGVVDLADTKIRFVLDDRIYFYVDDNLYTSCDGMAFRQKVVDTDPTRLEALAIYYTVGACTQNATPPSPSWMSAWPDPSGNFDYDQRVVQSVNSTSANYATAQTLAHELGHCMDLFHVYEPSCCHETCDGGEQDYLEDVFGPTPLTNCWQDGGWSCDPFAIGNTCTNNMMSGTALTSYYFSPLQIGKMHRALSVKSLNRYSLNVYQPEPLEVNTDEHWDFEMRVYRDVVVKTGHTLTITCKLEMPAEGRIIVEQGAKLVVDGGWITTADFSDTFWSGIQVWGTTTQHQFGSPYSTYQGNIVLKNGALIEHAREGIQTMNPSDWSMIGGIVEATDATFKNCRRAVSYVKYQNFNPNTLAPMPNRSRFTRCTFVVDDDYRGVDDFYAHVSMWYVDGIRFSACSFRNEQTTIGLSSKLGHGIISLDAKYTVSGKCNVILPLGQECPEADYTRGTFVGLDHGIHALNGSTDRAFTVDRCKFENNICGVFASGITGFSVTRNQFEFGVPNVVLLGDEDQNFDGRHRGVFSFSSSGFRIEENEFLLHSGALSETDAIVVNQTMEHNDVVYKNTAFGMRNGYIGEAQCIDPVSASSIGLQFLCNGNNGNAQNIGERQVALQPPLAFHGIRTQQGSPTSPASNTFDQMLLPLDASDFRNSTDWVLNYWHNGGISQPVDVTAGWVGTTLTVNQNACPSKFSNGGGHVLSQVKKEELELELQTKKLAYISTAYVFNSLLDGGNHDAVVQEVQDSWPQNAWELRNFLIAKSPYLSVDVLKKMMAHNTLPQPMVLEICLANPEATKQDGFLKWAQSSAPNPVPQYMADLIAGSWQAKTFRMELEATMGQQHADMSQAGYVLLSHFKNDTIGEPLDSLRLLWAELPNFGARMGEAMTLAQVGDHSGAIALLEAARDNYPMKSNREAEIDRAVALLTLLADVHATGRTVTQLNLAEQDALAQLGDGTYDRPSTWAWNILCFGYGRCRSTPSGGDQPTMRSFDTTTISGGGSVFRALAVLPNPATVVATFEYVLPTGTGDGIIVVRDATGREVERLPLTNTEGQTLWDTRRVAPGAYSIELLYSGKRIATERLVVKP